MSCRLSVLLSGIRTYIPLAVVGFSHAYSLLLYWFLVPPCWSIIRHEHTWVRSTIYKFHVFVTMAMTTPPSPAGTIHATVLVHQIPHNHKKTLSVCILRGYLLGVWCTMFEFQSYELSLVVRSCHGGEKLSRWLANWALDTVYTKALLLLRHCCYHSNRSWVRLMLHIKKSICVLYSGSIISQKSHRFSHEWCH